MLARPHGVNVIRCRVTHESVFLPVLYCTYTILRSHTSETFQRPPRTSPSAARSVNRSERPRANSRRPPRWSEPRPDQTFERERRGHTRDAPTRHAVNRSYPSESQIPPGFSTHDDLPFEERPSRQYSSRSQPHEEPSTPRNTQRTQSRPERRIDVPFERPPTQRDPYAELQLEGSTITPNERKAFESLFELHRPAAGASAPTKKSATPLPGLDALLSVPAGSTDARGRPLAEMPSALRVLAEQAQARKARGENAPGAAEQAEKNASPQRKDLTEAAKKELQSVSKAIDAAHTDLDVWQILHERVLNRLAALHLNDNKPSPSPPKPKPTNEETRTAAAAAAATQTSPPSPPLTPQQHSDLALLSQTLPHHLPHTLTHLQTHYPSSLLSLSLLPTLKALAPPSLLPSALTTKLYNRHLRGQIQHCPADVPALLATLQDMQAQGCECDAETLAVLDDVLVYAEQVGRGEMGQAVKVVWEMESAEKGLAEVAEWRRGVVVALEERALRRAMEREGG